MRSIARYAIGANVLFDYRQNIPEVYIRQNGVDQKFFSETLLTLQEKRKCAYKRGNILFYNLPAVIGGLKDMGEDMGEQPKPLMILEGIQEDIRKKRLPPRIISLEQLAAEAKDTRLARRALGMTYLTGADLKELGLGERTIEAYLRDGMLKEPDRIIVRGRQLHPYPMVTLQSAMKTAALIPDSDFAESLRHIVRKSYLAVKWPKTRTTERFLDVDDYGTGPGDWVPTSMPHELFEVPGIRDGLCHDLRAIENALRSGVIGTEEF
jgi:hypothetical protein